MSGPEARHDAAIKTMTRVLVETAGGLDAATAALRGWVGRAQVGNYTSRHHEQHIPVDVALRLMDVTGDIALLEEMARRLGYKLQRLGAVEPGCAVRVVSAVSQETSEVWKALSDGMADGTLDEADRDRIQGELLDVARVATEGAAALAGGCR